MQAGEIELEFARCWLDKDGIVRFVYKNIDVVSLRHAKEAVAAIAEVARDIRRPTLVDTRPTVKVTREAREYYASETSVNLETATALLIDSGYSRVIGNFFLGLNKPTIPTKLFTVQEEAISWLKTYLV